ncbi:MAG: hypothetical protein J6V71_00270 [Clostridia bacterium]|nr:hypothetical protein [Clostridia bacterium]
MATFMQVTKRINSNVIGVVTGPEWTSMKYPTSYIGFAEAGKAFFGLTTKKDMNHLMIYGVGIEDYVFGKEDIAKTTLVEEKSVIAVGSQRVYGPKYKVEFKDGKTAYVSIQQSSVVQVDRIINC